MKVLVLFSGTGSIEKIFDLNKDTECRGVDNDKHFKPYYLVDILTWDYKTELKDWVPDYIHSSPVCKEFSNLKNTGKCNTRHIGLGTSLLTKSLEIIEYIKNINSNLYFTIENPKGLMRKMECMKPYNRITTSYCKYGFKYQKDTDFWFGGFDLKLKPQCRKCIPCVDKKIYGYHTVRIGLSNKKDTGTYKRSGVNQIGCSQYFKELKVDNPDIKGYSDTYMRYRIPSLLITDIKNCIEN